MVTDIQTTTSLPDLIVVELHKQIKALGSQKAVADELDIPQSTITEILKGRRPTSESVAEKLGFVRITFFVKKSHVIRIISLLRKALEDDAHLQDLLEKVLKK